MLVRLVSKRSPAISHGNKVVQPCLRKDLAQSTMQFQFIHEPAFHAEWHKITRHFIANEGMMLLKVAKATATPYPVMKKRDLPIRAYFNCLCNQCVCWRLVAVSKFGLDVQ